MLSFRLDDELLLTLDRPPLSEFPPISRLSPSNVYVRILPFFQFIHRKLIFLSFLYCIRSRHFNGRQKSGHGISSRVNLLETYTLLISKNKQTLTLFANKRYGDPYAYIRIHEPHLYIPSYTFPIQGNKQQNDQGENAKNLTSKRSRGIRRNVPEGENRCSHPE